MNTDVTQAIISQFGPQADEVASFLDRVASLTPTEAKSIIDEARSTGNDDTVVNAIDATEAAGKSSGLIAAQGVASGVIGDLVSSWCGWVELPELLWPLTSATDAIIVRHLIPADAYTALTRPVVAVLGAVA